MEESSCLPFGGNRGLRSDITQEVVDTKEYGQVPELMTRAVACYSSTIERVTVKDHH